MSLTVIERQRQFQASLGHNRFHLLTALRAGARHDELQVRLTFKAPGGGLKKDAPQLAQLAVAAAGQQGQHTGIRLNAERLARSGAVRLQRNAVSQCVTNTAHSHTMAAIHLFLEGEQGQHQIGRLGNAQHALFTPGPNRRTDVMHGGNTHIAQALLYPQGEIRRVDADKHVRLLLLEVFNQLAANAQQLAQASEHLNQAHDRQPLHRHARLHALGQHARTADTDKTCIGKALFQRGDQASAQRIAGRLTGDQRDTKGLFRTRLCDTRHVSG